MGDAGSGGGCDVKAVLAFAGAIADQGRSRAEANQIGAGRNQPGSAGAGVVRHRDGGIGTAGLIRREPEKRRKRLGVIGNLSLDQQPGAAGHTQQLTDCPAAATGDRESSLAARHVRRGDQLLPRSVRWCHGVCAVRS